MPRDILKKRAYQLRYIQERRAAWLEANGPCSICGSWLDLEVDHINREDKISHKVWSWSEDRMLEELLKCQALCRICHAAKTGAENSAARSKPVVHGIQGGYRKGCRCGECKSAYSVARKTHYLTTGH
jgi:5-methylcytosine-specific restriction endonuclease McrA